MRSRATGDAEIDSPRRVTTDTTNPKTGTKTITDKLKHTFEAVDHGKKIHCMTAGSWLNLDDPREASAHLNVICERLLPSSGRLCN